MPIPAFTCCHCLLAGYDRDGLLRAPPGGEAGNFDRLTALLGLVRGRMLLLSQAKRTSTRASYRTGRRALDDFARRYWLQVLPASPGMLMDWAVDGLSGGKLDASTIKVRFGAAYDVYDYARTRLGLRALQNPLRDPELVAFGKILGANYKKRSRARRAVSLAVVRVMLAHGWDLRHAHGRWGRLRWTFLNLGMLRVGGVNQLIVVYSIAVDAAGVERVVLGEDSDVQVLFDETLRETYVDVNVDVDKNVGSWNRRRAFIPGAVDELQAHAVEWLHDYLLSVRPPSGGPLFARPTRKGFSAKLGNASADIKRAYKRACAAGGLQFEQELFDALGTHSGRKSLAQWLWDDGHCRRIIADAGGWFLKRDAVDLYFKTARHIILGAVRNVGRSSRSPTA